MSQKRASRGLEGDYENSVVRTALPRILIADDDKATRESLTQNACYRIVSVTDGREAFRVLRQDADFAAAVFNMTMPLLPGVDVLRYMKSEKRLMRIPVIIVCSDRGLTNVADSFAAGAIAFLAKPFASEQLHRVIRLAICSAGSENVARAA